MREWWEPRQTDAAWLKRIRDDYPDNAGESDDWLREYYAEGRRYAVTWDHTGDAYDQFEALADAYLKLRATDSASGCPGCAAKCGPDDPAHICNASTVTGGK